MSDRPRPFDPFDLVIEVGVRVRRFDDDPSADVQAWGATLSATRWGDDEIELAPVRIATCELYRINRYDTRYGPLETVTGLDRDLDTYSVLFAGDHLIVEDDPFDSLLVVHTTTVDPAYRGHGYGPWLTAEAIHLLAGITSLVACSPAPFQLDRDADPAGYTRRQRELAALWQRLGFRPFNDEVMILDPSETHLGDALAALRRTVGGDGAGE